MAAGLTEKFMGSEKIVAPQTRPTNPRSGVPIKDRKNA
jgi:hypothetical protein